MKLPASQNFPLRSQSPLLAPHPSHAGLYDPIYASIHYTFELVLLINLCLFSSLCHYRQFLFDRKHRWVQEKLVLLFHFPDRYLLSHANPLTPVTTSEPPTLLTITNLSVLHSGPQSFCTWDPGQPPVLQLCILLPFVPEF